MWRSKYDMPPDAFAADIDRVWQQLRPLYVSLHTYVRHRLREHYGDVVPEAGPCRRTCSATCGSRTGRTSTRSWRRPMSGRPVSLTEELKKRRRIDRWRWCASASGSSRRSASSRCPDLLGAEQFVKPRDREVVCHASAWNVDQVDDLRIKMCIEQTPRTSRRSTTSSATTSTSAPTTRCR
jgi:peptidyl-dipeptidase A